MNDEARAEAFADRVVGILNSGSLALMISVGHRTRLFDTMATMPPATSAQIAEKAGLNERYVREWLGAMVAGSIVEYDPERKLYGLPAEHSACLTREAARDNLAPFTQYISVLGGVEDKIIECFKSGGGVPYSEFPRFHAVMAEDSGQTVVPALLDHILPLVPGLVDRLKEGIQVLDVGCGAGRALNMMARHFPKSHFAGYDFSEEAIEAGRAQAERSGLTNLRFDVRDAASLGERERYDLITTFDAVHDQKDPAAVLHDIHEALRADGVYLMQDIAGSSHVEKNVDHPMGPFLYTISCMHCMTVSLALGGAGLGAMWGEEKAREMLDEAGFESVEVKRLGHDIQNNYYVIRKS